MTQDIFTYKDTSPKISTEMGSLAGKKIVIQPNMSIRGWPANAGSRALEGFTALEDATVITRLKDAGAIIVGSACMSELGFGLAKDTCAEVVKRGEADISLITDTMGEARMAASISGTFGFKPSWGIVSRSGLIGLVPSMESYGILAKDINDIITCITVISGKDDNDFSMPDETLPDFGCVYELTETKFAVGIIKECLDALSDRESKTFKSGLAKIEEAGLTVQELSLRDFNLFRTVHNVIGSVEASSSAGKYDGVRYGHRSSAAKNWNEMYLNSRGESFGTLIKAYLFQGAYFQFENYSAFENACRIRRRLIHSVNNLFDQVDFLALPTRLDKYDPANASTINETYDAFSTTLTANITGHPVLQISSPVPDSQIDLGFQLIGPRLSDARLLSVGIKL